MLPPPVHFIQKGELAIPLNLVSSADTSPESLPPNVRDLLPLSQWVHLSTGYETNNSQVLRINIFFKQSEPENKRMNLLSYISKMISS